MTNRDDRITFANGVSVWGIRGVPGPLLGSDGDVAFSDNGVRYDKVAGEWSGVVAELASISVGFQYWIGKRQYNLSLIAGSDGEGVGPECLALEAPPSEFSGSGINHPHERGVEEGSNINSEGMSRTGTSDGAEIASFGAGADVPDTMPQDSSEPSRGTVVAETNNGVQDPERNGSIFRRNAPLLRSSVSLSSAAGLAAFGGFIFWLLIARIASPGIVGTAAALYSSVQFVNYVTGLGLPIAVARYGSSPKHESSVLFNWSVVLTVASSFVGAVIYFAIVPRELHELPALGVAGSVIIFGLIVAGISIFTVLDVRLISQHRRSWVVGKAVFVGLVRLPFVFVPAIAHSVIGIFFVAAGAPALCGFLAWVFADLRCVKFRFPLRPLPDDARAALSYSVVNGAAQLAVQGPFYLLPVIVLIIVSPRENASFYVAWTIASVLFLIAQGVGQALLVEGNRSGRLGSQTRSALQFGLALGVGLFVVCLIGSKVVPVLYGPSYTAGAQIMPILGAAVIPWAVFTVVLAMTRVRHNHRRNVALSSIFAVSVLIPAAVLVAKFGINGAAWSWFIGNVVAALAALVVLRQIRRTPAEEPSTDLGFLTASGLDVTSGDVEASPVYDRIVQKTRRVVRGSGRRSAIGGALLWSGTIAYGGSTVALLAVLSRHSDRSEFTAVAAILSLSFVVSLIPAGIMLRSASLVADGRPPPLLRVRAAIVVTAVSVAISPFLAYLLHVPVLAAAIVTVQMVVGIPLSIRQGTLLGRRGFSALGVNLFLEGGVRFAIGAIGGLTFGVTGLALGLCAGTTIAFLALPPWRPDGSLQDRPRTSMTATSASLALLGLFVQLDILMAPSVVSRGGAATYDLAAVPSKGVYLVLLAAGPLIFPSVRGRLDRRIIVGAVAIALAVGMLCTTVLVMARHLIAAVLGRPPADPLELALLGLAMALAGVTGITVSAGIARGIRYPWPPLLIGIAVMLSCWPWQPTPLAFSVVVLASQAVTAILSFALCLRHPSARATGPTDPAVEILAETGDPFVAAQAIPILLVAKSDGEPAKAEARSTSFATVAVVIPTLQRPARLQELLKSLAASTRVPDEIVVVDNDPKGSVAGNALPPKVQLVHGGYGTNVPAALNLGWRSCLSDVCIFVDSNNEVDSRCIEELTEACEDESVGIAVPVVSSDVEGAIDGSRWARITRWKRSGNPIPADVGVPCQTDSKPGVYALRRDVLERLGGFDDEASRVPGEERDLGERIAAFGLTSVIVPDEGIRPYGEVSETPG